MWKYLAEFHNKLLNFIIIFTSSMNCCHVQKKSGPSVNPCVKMKNPTKCHKAQKQAALARLYTAFTVILQVG